MILVKLPDGRKLEYEIHEQMTGEDLLSTAQPECDYPLLMANRDRHYIRLDTPLVDGDVVQLFDIRNGYTYLSYQMSLAFLYLAAVKQTLGEDVQVTISNSLSKGIFTRIHIHSVTDEIVHQIESRMKELVNEDVLIGEMWMNRYDMIRYLKEEKKKEELELFESAYDLSSAYLNTLCGYTELFYQHLVPSTGYLKNFELRRYRNGVLLRFAQPEDPDHIPEYKEQKLLYEAFSEETHWEHLLGIQTAYQLNENVLAGDDKEMILLSEALHEKKIAEIAEMIHSSHKRLVLIAGPSSSGKTSFAKRLCTQLRVIGLRPLYLGTDDYFLDRSELIPDENGELDFESLSAVDTELFTHQMNALLNGHKVDIPEFDFIEGKKNFGKRIVSIEKDQPIVIEGIHGLNPQLTLGIEDEQKFKIYISPLAQLRIDQHHRIPTTDARMLRRMVRDHRTRGKSAAGTIHDWPSVRKGEEVNIFPYSDQADVFFNSNCIYELAVLKKYCEPLLKRIRMEEPEYEEAQRMLDFLEFFVVQEDERAIPNHSIIREFIGGSVLVN